MTAARPPSPVVDTPPAVPAADGSLRIALAIERFTTLGGGAERSTWQIAERLVERGHRVAVIAPLTRRADVVEGLPFAVERLPRPPKLKAVALVRARRWVAARVHGGGYDASVSMTTSFPADVVQPRAGVTAGFQRQRIARQRFPWQRWLKRLEVEASPKQRVLRLVERRTLDDPRVRRFVAISGLMAEQLETAGGVDPGRIVSIPNGSETIEVDDAQRAELRAAVRLGLGLAADAPLLVFAARDPARKGGAELVAAMKALADRRPDARLAVVGDGGYAMHRAAVEAGVRDRVLLLGPTRRVDELFAAADATVLPSWYDPASKVVIESLMVGTPAITTRLNGAAERVDPAIAGGPGAGDAPGSGLRGRVIDSPADAGALVEAMLAMCDPAERAKAAANCVGLHAELSMDRHADRLEAVLREVVAEKASAAA